MVADAYTHKIICLNFAKGKIHDFTLFKNSKLKIRNDIKILADKGYQGIQEIYPNSEIPKKCSKNNPLTKEEKQRNHVISLQRLPIEHINCCIKRFKIISSKYRNHIKKFCFRCSLICGIYNYQI